MLLLGLDIGTQGTKGLLLDAESGQVVARASAAHAMIEGLPAGAAEQDPEGWIAAVRQVAADLRSAVPQAFDSASGVQAVGVSGQQHGLVVLDERGAVVRPAKLWCDTSTVAEARELSTLLGRHVPVGYTASKVLWLARHEPQNWARVRRVLLPHDFLNFRLTGRACMECGDASGTGFFDPLARRFDIAAAAAIDARLPGLLPPLLTPGAPAGVLSREGAALLGLREGLPVASGSGDNMCSALGAGASRPGVLVVSLGTSGTVFAQSERPIIDPAGLIAPFCDATGRWLPLLCVMSCTNFTAEVAALCAQTGAPGGDSPAASTSAADRDCSLFETLTREAAAEPPGSGGLLFLPYLQGERVPDLPLASAALLGLRPGSLRRGALFRAAIEGVCLNLAWGVDRLAALGVSAEQVRVVGGGARNALWRQILADVLNRPVVATAEPESAALGAALLALWTVRRTTRAVGASASDADAVAAPYVHLSGEPCQPQPESVAFYREAGSRFRERATTLFGAR